MIVHKHEASVGFYMFIDLVVGEGPGLIAFGITQRVVIRRIVIIERRIVRDPGLGAVLVVGQILILINASLRAQRAKPAIGVGARPATTELRTVGIGEDQGAVGIVAGVLADGFHLAITEIAHDVTTAFIDIATGGHVEVILLAVPDILLGQLETGVGLNPAQIIIIVGVLVDTVLGIDTNALQLLAHDEVDDARHGVRTIDRRRAAGQHIRALNQRRRNEIEVNTKRRQEALAVNQDQRTVATKAAQVDACRTIGVVRLVFIVAGFDLRQRLQERIHGNRALELDFLGIDRGDRRGALEVRTADTCTCHHNCRGLCFIGCRRCVLRESLRHG